MPSSPRGFFAVCAAALVGGLVLAWSPVGTQFDLWAYDILLRLTPPDQAPNRSVILSIDEASLADYGGITGLREPLARTIDILADHEPSVIALDIVLAERREEAADASLAAALAASPRDVLAAYLRPAGDGWEGPREELARHASVLGHVHAEPDRDGVCRRIILAKASGRQRLWAMALEALRLSSGAERVVESEDELRVGDTLVPASAEAGRELLIRFPLEPVQRLSMKTVLENPAAAEAVRGKAVFVGVLVLAGTDRYLMTPYSQGLPLSGVEINAAVYETLAGGDFLTPMRPSTSLLLALALSAALVAVLWLSRRAGSARLLAGAAAVLAAAHAAPWAAMANGTAPTSAELLFPAWACALAGGAYSLSFLRGRLDESEQRTERYRRAVHYITHEMRTPLTTIQGSSQLIRDYDLDDEKRTRVSQTILSESKRLASMVDAFLNVERLAAGRLDLHVEPVLPGDLIDSCVARASDAAARKSISIDAEVMTNEPISGDREFLESACYNLLTNAVKYSPAQTAIIVRARSEGGQILVSVEDQGYGMDENDLQNIFRRFYRSRTAADSGESGVGVGLALVEEIVVQHGGSIQVESELGRGSCFTLCLPAAESGV